MWICKGPIIKESKVRGLTLLNFKTNYKATVINCLVPAQGWT